MWQTGENVDGTRQALHQRFIRIAADLHPKVDAASRIAVIGVRDVDVVGSLSLEQIRVQSHAEEAILCEGLIHLVNRDRYLFRAVGRIDAGDSLADPLSDPQESIRPPRHFPWSRKVGRHDPRDERLWSLRRDYPGVCYGNGTL